VWPFTWLALEARKEDRGREKETRIARRKKLETLADIEIELICGHSTILRYQLQKLKERAQRNVEQLSN
jgi:hypothetical protein